MNKFARISRRVAAVGSALVVSAGSALAAVPETVNTELSGAKTDVMTVGGLVFAVAIGIVIFKWFRRAL